jgi:hypothetical protein
MATETTVDISKATPRPWTFDPAADYPGGLILGPDGESVRRGDLPHEVLCANGALAVQAVNAHDALVTACDAALCAIRLERQLNPGFSAAWEHIERPLVAALAAAKGGR